MDSNSSDARFDELFGNPAIQLLPSSNPSPAVVSPRWTSRLDSLHDSELISAVKKMSTSQLLVEWRNRSKYGVAADLTRQQLIVNVVLHIQPERTPVTGEPSNLAKLVANANLAMVVSDDPTGEKRNAAKRARQTQFSLAGQVGAQGTKTRRAQLAAEVQVSVPSKYTDDEVRLIRWMCANGWKDEAVANHFGNRTKPAMVWAIRKGVSYKSVSGVATSGPAAPAPVRKHTLPSAHNRRS